jgi:hypothetical protein
MGPKKRTGKPTGEELRALFIEDKPEDILKT